MGIITIEEIKLHTRIDSGAEDDLLELYGESAEATVMNLLGKSLEQLKEENEGEVPAPVRHACLMLVDHSYAQRSPASVSNLYSVPYTFDALIKPYMSL